VGITEANLSLLKQGHVKGVRFAAALLRGALAGCANTHWERALYEGMRQGESAR